VAESVFDDPATQNFIRKGIQPLRDEFRGIFSHETIQRFVDEATASLADARVKDFVPLFVNRFARERLRALAQVQGSIAKGVPEVLFVCVHNAGRSQMAAALLDHHANGRVHVRSAGSTPANEINRAVVEAWPSSASTSRRNSRSRSRTSSLRPPTWSSRWLRRRLPDLSW
jgi:arsenate reductase